MRLSLLEDADRYVCAVTSFSVSTKELGYPGWLLFVNSSFPGPRPNEQPIERSQLVDQCIENQFERAVGLRAVLRTKADHHHAALTLRSRQHRRFVGESLLAQ